MKKALRIGVASLALAAVCTTGAIFDLERTSDNDFAAPYVQTAVLKQGATGGEVKELQRRLKMWGYYSGSVDGIYGPATQGAVTEFQKIFHLPQTGSVDFATWYEISNVFVAVAGLA